jgi:hypothetical protein
MSLLKSDKFSKKGPFWLEANKEINQKFIKENFFEGTDINIKDLKILDSLQVNSSNFFAKIDGEKVIVKLLNNLSRDEFKKKFKIYQFLSEKKVFTPKLSKIYKKKEIRNFSLKKNILFLEYINGRYFNGSYEDLKKTSSSLKKLNKNLREMNNDLVSELKIYPKSAEFIIKKFFLLFEKKSFKFNKKLNKSISMNKENILRSNKENILDLNKVRKEKREIFHIDLHPHNILIQKDKALIIDIDSIMLTRWHIGIGFTFFKLLRQTMTKKRDLKILKHKSLNFLKTAFNCKNDSELWQELIKGARIEIMRRILLIFEENNKTGKSSWNEVLEIQIRSLNDLKIIEKVFTNS